MNFYASFQSYSLMKFYKSSMHGINLVIYIHVIDRRAKTLPCFLQAEFFFASVDEGAQFD